MRAASSSVSTTIRQSGRKLLSKTLDQWHKLVSTNRRRSSAWFMISDLVGEQARIDGMADRADA